MKCLKQCLFALVSVTFFMGTAVTVSASDSDKNEVIFAPSAAKGIFSLKKGNTEFLPLRTVTERIGGKVNWNNDTKTIEVIYHNYCDEATIIKFKAGENQYLKNNITIELDKASMLHTENGKNEVYVPMDFFSEILNVELVFPQ